MSAYEWGSPAEWLEEKAAKWTKAQLRDALHRLVATGGVDSDTLQDVFAADMADDGYCEEISS